MPYLLSLILLSLSFSVQAFFSNQQEFLPVEEAFQLRMYEATEDTATLHWSVTPAIICIGTVSAQPMQTVMSLSWKFPRALKTKMNFSV